MPRGVKFLNPNLSTIQIISRILKFRITKTRPNFLGQFWGPFNYQSPRAIPFLRNIKPALYKPKFGNAFFRDTEGFQKGQTVNEAQDEILHCNKRRPLPALVI